jgi:hypothetical protein
MLRNGYVLFDETIEKILPEEEDIANRIIASGQRACRRVFEKEGVAVRAAHAKGHGILKGELTVDANLPEYLRQGVFADPRTYPVIVRYSTAFGDIRSDRIKSAPWDGHKGTWSSRREGAPRGYIGHPGLAARKPPGLFCRCRLL